MATDFQPTLPETGLSENLRVQVRAVDALRHGGAQLGGGWVGGMSYASVPVGPERLEGFAAPKSPGLRETDA